MGKTEKILARMERKDLTDWLAKLYSWAEDSRRIVPEQTLNRGDNPAKIINHLLREGYCAVDAVILTYEKAIKETPKLEQEHPRNKVYAAGTACYADIGRRYDRLCEQALALGLMTEVQITALEKNEEAGPEFV